MMQKTLAPNPDPAGVLTSRAFIQAHADAGTNRRLVEYLFRNFMCVPIQEWADSGASDLRIGRDIDRFPGGDHTVFQNTCKACHTVMDGFRGAFARWDFRNGNAINASLAGTGRAGADADGNMVSRKMNKNNNVYSGGYVTTDDSWVNNAIRASNVSLFGWRAPVAGPTNGVQGLGRLIANSQRFSQCMAEKVFDVVCKKV